MKKVLSAIIAYLKDWKNWLVHSIIGITILLVAFFLPVRPVYRILILVVVVGFNVLRMKLEKKRVAKKDERSRQDAE